MQTIRLYLGIIRDSIKGWRTVFVLHNLTLQEAHKEGENIVTFVFKSNRKFNYQAGQYGVWILKRWVNGKPARLFTVASPPEEGVVQLSTRISGTDFKQKLAKLMPGDTMWMFGPIGGFTLPKQLPREVVFAAGGIGITPIRALAKHIHDTSLPIESTLIHSGQDFYLYKDELEGYVTTAHFTTRTDFDAILSQVASTRPDAIFYISGPPKFVEAARKLLLQANVRHIKTDGFLGY
jgi:ferredoxin-NADP reductase